METQGKSFTPRTARVSSVGRRAHPMRKCQKHHKPIISFGGRGQNIPYLIKTSFISHVMWLLHVYCTFHFHLCIYLPYLKHKILILKPSKIYITCFCAEFPFVRFCVDWQHITLGKIKNCSLEELGHTDKSVCYAQL